MLGNRHLLCRNPLLSRLDDKPRMGSDKDAVRFWIIAVPVFVAFIAVMGIGAWIGWTMATTPPPKPIEEITSELEEKEEEKAPEEAKEEEKPKRKRKSE